MKTASMFRLRKLTFGKDFCGFLFGDTLHLLKSPSRSIGNGLDSLIASIHHQLNITLCKARKTLKDCVSNCSSSAI